MTTTETVEQGSGPGSAPERKAGELTIRELLRFAWRQLTSMRTALVLLLLLALAAVPGSVIPQERVDSLKSGQWQDKHETLAPIYDRLGLFNVYGSPWFAAIYILLMVSLVGCIIPRTFHYLRAIRSEPPPAPRNLTRLPAHASYVTTESPEEVLERARAMLKRKRYRLRTADGDATVSSEKGYLREVGNLIFHLAVLVVLVGFALGTLFGYKGGVILITGTPFGNNLTSYDDFVPGQLFDADNMEPFSFTVDDFDVDWLRSGPKVGMARGFDAQMRYQESPGAPEKSYDLKVNHPLSIGSTELFLIGHGYAPVVTIRDGEGNVAWSAPMVFLPQGPDLFSFGVIKAPDAKPAQVGLEGFLYPTYAKVDGQPINVGGDDINPLISMNVYTGDLGLDAGTGQSIYVLDKSTATPLPGKGDQPLRIDLQIGDTVELPDGLGTVSFDDMVSWQRIQISQTPGKHIALLGVVLALLGLMGSLFIRSRRVWLRVTEGPTGTLVEIAALDRSGGADTDAVLSTLVADLTPPGPHPDDEPDHQPEEQA